MRGDSLPRSRQVHGLLCISSLQRGQNFDYDSTFVGNNYALMNDDFHTFITNYLTDHGWYVNEVYLGNPMGHIEKMLLD